MHIPYRDTELPVLRQADTAVVGGSLAGIAAALTLTRAGESVVLIEPRTYLGHDITATLRPWLMLDEASDTARLSEPIRTILDAHTIAGYVPAGEIPLHPDTVKRCLEDALLAEGAGLIYASLATGLCEDGLVIGNKSGRQVIRCRTIIDATATALVARLAGAAFEPPATKTARMSRTLEFDRVQPLGVTTLPVPACLGIADDQVRLHEGCRGPAHLLAECALDLAVPADLEGAGRAELEARRRTMRLVEFLVDHYPDIAAARFAGSSHELHGRWTSSLAGPSPEWAAFAKNETVSWAGDSPASGPPLSRFAGPVPDLWCLNEAARLDAAQARCLLDPVNASRLGERLAAALVSTRHGLHARPARWSMPAPLRRSGHDEIPGLEIREPDSPQRGRRYERAMVETRGVPMHRNVDILVTGGGSSGATAAITAAREGMRTLLVDMNPGPGGAGTYGGVDSYWYGRHVGFAARLERAVDAQHGKINHTGGKWNIDAKTWVLLAMANAAGVESVFNAFAIGAVMDGTRIRGVIVATRWGVVCVLAEVVIDATGDGDIAAFAGAAFTYGAERTHSVMWYSLAQYASPALIKNNFTTTVDVSNIEDYTRAILAGRRRGNATHDHGIYVATRESRHIRGGVTMTLTDQLRHRRWRDVVNIHYSNHDIKGQTESDWLRSGLIPPNLEVEIPYRLVVPEGIDGLLIAGKAISVTHDGLPAVRMQADLENLGGVVALASAQAIREGTNPRDIDIGRLQRRLIDDGLLPGDVLTRDLREGDPTKAELEEYVAALTGDAPLYSYSDMHMGELFYERIPFVEICAAGPRAVPLLEVAHDNAAGPRRLVLAQALAMCGGRAGVPTLIDAIVRAIDAEQLPVRDSNIRHAGFPPDQGAMPDVVYLLFSLGMTPDERSLPVWERIVALLAPTSENLRDRFTGTFYYVDALCRAADRARVPEMLPILERLHGHAALRDQVCRDGFQADVFDERRAILELGIARAMARCGSRDGLDLLVAYLDDVRGLLAERAHDELIDLTGVDHGKDASAWTTWLANNRAAAAPVSLAASAV